LVKRAPWEMLIGRRIKRDAYIPTSYVVYKILEKMKCDVKPYKWIACAGIIGDYGKCMMEREIMKHGKRVSDLITSAIVLKSVKGSEKAKKLLIRSETPYDFSTSELEKWHKIFVKEKNRIIADFETKKEIYGDFIFYEIKSRMNLTSTISSVISERYPRNVIIIRKKSGDFWKISLRCQSGKLNVGEIARKASEGIGSGGGHEKSSGAVVNDWETFKKRVLLFGS
jgi:single-stranded DNA-specific DHH superfamily exonuclease